MTLPDQVLDHLCRVVGDPDLSNTRYEMLGLIARGGMGAVYCVRDIQLDRKAALKVIDVALRDNEQPLTEARLLAQLEHPGIVAVYDAGVLADGRSFYVMRLVDGRRLDAYLNATPPLSERLSVLEKLCDVIAFAHSRQVIHRDLKPENIMIGAFGEVTVLDWDVALSGAAGAHGADTVAGTSRYMAPEQSCGNAIDCRSDIYSLGVVMGELLPDDSPRPLRAIAAKACSPDKLKRYSAVAEMAADVRRYQDRLRISAYSETLVERVARIAARNRVLLFLVAAYVLVRVLLFFLRPR